MVMYLDERAVRAALRWDPLIAEMEVALTKLSRGRVIQPVRNTLNYGQVNLALMALVAADCLVRSPRWPRGALTGIAAAVKLTPAAFVLFFLLRRDWRAAVTAAVSFAVCTGAGFLLDGRDSAAYWTSVLFQSGRPGSPAGYPPSPAGR